MTAVKVETLHGPGGKACTNCGVVQPLEAFSPHPQKTDGRQSWCKDCASDYVRNLRSRDPELRARTKAQKRAYAAAQTRLREAYRDEFDKLYDEEKRRLGLDAPSSDERQQVAASSHAD